MGEMADMIIGSWDGDDIYEHSRTQSSAKTCRCCGEEGLHWKNVDNKWILHEFFGSIHECPKNPLKENAEVGRGEAVDPN